MQPPIVVHWLFSTSPISLRMPRIHRSDSLLSRSSIESRAPVPQGRKPHVLRAFCGTTKQLAEKVSAATNAFAAAKAGHSFCSLFGMTESHALLQGAPQERFSASCKAMPCYKSKPALLYDGVRRRALTKGGGPLKIGDSVKARMPLS
jgi:hypothetical protein